ncbi:MAG: tetratricopeptide repeat protein [Bacteroidales bacterium]|nr:tetratricopeptide repeat protein [Bacteroidales bacterium]
MSKKKKIERGPDNIEAVENVLSRSEQFIEDNQKLLTTIVLVVVAIVGLYLAYHKWYLKPLDEEANSQMFVAEQYFERDSFNLALNGDLNYPGFLAIIDEYSSTQAANLANYYAGISYLQLGQFENAVEYLSSFDSEDKMLKPISLGAIGDAYMELKNTEKAIEYYQKAGNFVENDFTSPLYLMRAGLALESIKDYKGALKQYRVIKEKYKNTTEGRTIDKYIDKAEILAKD